MKYFTTACLVIVSCITGVILYAYQKEWIIIVPPYQTAVYQPEDTHEQLEHRTISLFFFKHNQWSKEDITIIWSSDASYNVKTISNNWFMLLEDEKIIDKDIQVVSAIISPAKELFISLSKEPFNKQDATYIKLMIVQGLLKTLYENKVPVQSVRFLIHHQPLVDDHLNFSISWPLSGFL